VRQWSELNVTKRERRRTMINLEQQRDYLKILKTMYNKIYRLWGEGSDQELAMLDILVREKAKLARMEVGDV
jgi:hypothetical protein